MVANVARSGGRHRGDIGHELFIERYKFTGLFVVIVCERNIAERVCGNIAGSGYRSSGGVRWRGSARSRENIADTLELRAFEFSARGEIVRQPPVHESQQIPPHLAPVRVAAKHLLGVTRIDRNLPLACMIARASEGTVKPNLFSVPTGLNRHTAFSRRFFQRDL